MNLEIYDKDGTYVSTKARVINTVTTEKNKELLLDFAEDCLVGFNTPRLDKLRVVTLLMRLRLATIAIDKEWLMFDERDLKKVLIWIDEKFPMPDGAWTQHGYKICVRKFVTWMRRKYSYPETYSNRSKLIELLSLSKYAYEVSRMDIKKPDKLRDAHTIPTDQEMEFLCNAAVNPRDNAYIEMSREHGERIGGLGTRQIKHVKFDQIGAVVTIHDKTFKGEPVRYIASTIYLRQWLEKHPFKNDPEAPLWIDMTKLPKCIPLNYDGFKAIIQRIVERHNRNAQKFNLPLINKHITTHLFRYYAQTRDERQGMPRTIMCKLRGWTLGSRQPEQYARLTTDDVDEYLQKKAGLEIGERDNPDKLVKCVRCKEINQAKSTYCLKCGLPMSGTAVIEMEDMMKKMDVVLGRLMQDKEFAEMFDKKVTQLDIDQK
ncbi:MAG: hypothetical protein Q8O41_10050 [Candidatus Methanoperedens sp.]|nr:hypothetical protein [Candidatus Methanoperedens sp.]